MEGHPRDIGENTPAPHGFAVEVWTGDERVMEQVAAWTSNQAVGFATYVAARKHYPGKTLVLRAPWGVLSRWVAQPG